MVYDGGFCDNDDNSIKVSGSGSRLQRKEALFPDMPPQEQVLDANRRLKVALLQGGTSPEREGSFMFANVCREPLKALGHEVVDVDVGKGIVERLQEIQPDVAFNALLGGTGEDGTIQGVLEMMGIPYTHSGVRASAIGMDKWLARSVYASHGLAVAEGCLATPDSLAQSHPLTPPYVLKPRHGGSSINLHLIKDGPPRAPDGEVLAWLAERYVPGRDLSVGVLDGRVLPVCEIKTDRELWDFAIKYEHTGASLSCPAVIPDAVYQRVQKMAVAADQALGCRGVSRSDFRWDESKGLDGLVILETNTQPALFDSGTSLLEMLAVEGLSLKDLCAQLLADASTGR